MAAGIPYLGHSARPQSAATADEAATDDALVWRSMHDLSTILARMADGRNAPGTVPER